MTKRIHSMLVRFVPGVRSLLDRGSAGWMILVGTIIVVSLVAMTLLGPFIAPHNPVAPNVGPRLSSPSSAFPFGTTRLGEDMLSRVLTGGGIMLQVAGLSALICFAIGVPIGLFSSYVGGKVDKTLSLIMDSIYSFPGLVLAIALAAMLGRGVVSISFAISVVYIPSYFRIVRSQVLTIKELQYTAAAEAAGARWHTIIFSHILPNVIPSIVVVASLNFADAILTAAGLTFVGLGVEVDVPDWGRDLTNGRQVLASGAWWVITFPGLMIILLAFGFTLVGEGLSEVTSPKLMK